VLRCLETPAYCSRPSDTCQFCRQTKLNSHYQAIAVRRWMIAAKKHDTMFACTSISFTPQAHEASDSIHLSGSGLKSAVLSLDASSNKSKTLYGHFLVIRTSLPITQLLEIFFAQYKRNVACNGQSTERDSSLVGLSACTQTLIHPDTVYESADS
jgi:hypothetical protein